MTMHIPRKPLNTPSFPKSETNTPGPPSPGLLRAAYDLLAAPDADGSKAVKAGELSFFDEEADDLMVHTSCCY